MLFTVPGSITAGEIEPITKGGGSGSNRLSRNSAIARRSRNSKAGILPTPPNRLDCSYSSLLFLPRLAMQCEERSSLSIRELPPEKTQFNDLEGDKKAYALEIRPRLVVGAIQQLQDAQVLSDRMQTCYGSPWEFR